MAFEYSRSLNSFFGWNRNGALTYTPAIDTAFVWKTSGDAFVIRAIAPVSQTTATVTVYVFARVVTGSPTFELEIRDGYDVAAAGGDPQRPDWDGAVLSSSPSSLSLTSADNDTWVSLTATVTLTAGNMYFYCIKNTHATPASNHSTFAYRSALDSTFLNNSFSFATCGYTENGFSTDPTTNASGCGPHVIKFSDGTLCGMPYVDLGSHASNANDRGNRVQFSEDTVVSGVYMAAANAVTGIEINAAIGGANLVTATANDAVKYTTIAAVRFAPVTLQGGVAYDIVATYGSSRTENAPYGMGEVEANVPADVIACRWPGQAYVDGTTPGSYTADTSKVTPMQLLIDDNPAIASGGGGAVLAGRVLG